MVPVGFTLECDSVTFNKVPRESNHGLFVFGGVLPDGLKSENGPSGASRLFGLA
jgi:hypothetical protein